MKLNSAVFYTNDLEKVVEFYRDFIGLKVEYIQEGRFVSFKFETGKLGIKQKKEDREIPGSQTIFVEVPAVEKVYKEYKEKGATFYKELTHDDWATNFAILDPDGNKIEFIQLPTK